MHLSIKQDEYGYGFYSDGEMWRYFKHGDDFVGFIETVVGAGFTSVSFDGQMTEEESEAFC